MIRMLVLSALFTLASVFATSAMAGDELDSQILRELLMGIAA